MPAPLVNAGTPNSPPPAGLAGTAEIRPSLTLTYGLRYEINGKVTDRQNRLSSIEGDRFVIASDAGEADALATALAIRPALVSRLSACAMVLSDQGERHTAAWEAVAV